MKAYEFNILDILSYGPYEFLAASNKEVACELMEKGLVGEYFPDMYILTEEGWEEFNKEKALRVLAR